MLFLINNSIANGSERKKYLYCSRPKDDTIHDIYTSNSIPYNEYNNFKKPIKYIFWFKFCFIL